MAKTWSQADVVALVAQLLAAGGRVDNQLMADVTGKATPASYQHKMRTVVRHAKLVVEDRAKGGKGLLSALPGAEESAACEASASPGPKGKGKGKRKAVEDDNIEDVVHVKRGKKAEPKSEVKDEGTKTENASDEGDTIRVLSKPADDLDTDYEKYAF